MSRSAPKTFEPAKALALADESLLQIFNRYFRTVSADTPDLLRQAQEIRYKVYCVEHQFENSAEHPDGREKDEFDAHAVHSLLIHQPSGEAVGTVRLVLPRRDAPDRSFVIQGLVGPAMIAGDRYFPILTTAEVSRFSISKQLRRRKTDTLYGDEVFNAADNSTDRRSGPLMSLGLIQTLVRMSAQHKITHWCAVMEPKLLRFLAAMAIHFEPIGPRVEYHGLRQPCYCQIRAVLDRVKRERPMFWEVLTDGGTLWQSTDEANAH
jgi:N-acyl amino acid synthase of PEP-CTERM/exosortase system